MANLNRANFGAASGTQRPSGVVVLTELLAAFREPDPDLDHIVELITIEPALAAEVLKLSNSVSFAGSEPARDVFEAVSRIGMYEAYSTVKTLTRSLPAHAQLSHRPSETGSR
jgi:HD-like signal output (HDOD) protein